MSMWFKEINYLEITVKYSLTLKSYSILYTLIEVHTENIYFNITNLCVENNVNVVSSTTAIRRRYGLGTYIRYVLI